jgi:hypothetical protein
VLPLGMLAIPQEKGGCEPTGLAILCNKSIRKLQRWRLPAVIKQSFFSFLVM